jgi:Zn-dependent oligopeptidase
MKAILEFNLDELEDEQRFKRCNKSDDMAFAIWDIVYNTKKRLEYSVENKEINKYETIEIVFDEIYSILNKHNVSIDELTN